MSEIFFQAMICTECTAVFDANIRNLVYYYVSTGNDVRLVAPALNKPNSLW